MVGRADTRCRIAALAALAGSDDAQDGDDISYPRSTASWTLRRGGLSTIGQIYPRRRVIACLLPATHVAIDTGGNQARRNLWREQEMIDSQARVTTVGIPKVIPKGVNALARVKLPKCIRPSLATSR